MPRTALPADHPVYDEIVEIFLGYGPTFESVVFRPLLDRHLRVLSVSGTLGVLVGRDIEVTTWSGNEDGSVPQPGAEQTTWVRIAVTENGKTEVKTGRLGSNDSIAMQDEDEKEWVQDGIGLLLDLLEVATPGHEGLSGAALVLSYIQLNAATQRGMLLADEGQDPFDDDDDDDHHDHGNPHHREWHHDVDDFAQQCRLGFLYHVAVQESPLGGFDISAETLAPTMQEMVSLKVFMHQGELEDKPGHWFAAGELTAPAHGQGVDMAGLLSGFPAAARDFIGHSLEHLHAMGHLAGDIVHAKIDEVFEMSSEEILGRTISGEVMGLLVTAAVADALAGLNGIARLHTGSAEPPIPGGVRG